MLFSRSRSLKNGGVNIASEKIFETKIKKLIDSVGGYEVKFFANGYTKSGVPDVLACINGYFIGIEVKAQNGRISALQMHHIDLIRKAGGFAFVLYPSGFDRFKQFVAELKQDNFTADMPMIIK